MGFVFAGVVFSVLCVALISNSGDLNELRYLEFLNWKTERRIRSRSNTLENVKKKFGDK